MTTQPLSNPFALADPAVLKGLLRRHGFTWKKRLGQNFLIDARVLARLIDAAELRPDDGVFEVGPGAGVVTRLAATRARRVVAVEKDASLRPVLAEVLAGLPHVEVVFADVLKLRLPDVWGRFHDCAGVKVIANLPYYVTTPILFHLLEAGVRMDSIVVMVQREVAQRLAAAPGSKDYGALSVAVQYRCSVERVLQVRAGAFLPPPEVDSAVVRLRVRGEPPVAVRDEQMFFRVVRAAFATRRKTLANALTGGLEWSKELCAAVLARAGVDGGRRGETLSLQEFAAVADAWAALTAT